MVKLRVYVLSVSGVGSGRQGQHGDSGGGSDSFFANRSFGVQLLADDTGGQSLSISMKMHVSGIFRPAWLDQRKLWWNMYAKRELASPDP